MADPDGGREQNPRTLNTGGDAEPSEYVPGVSAPVVTSKDRARQEEDLFYGFLSNYTRQGRTLAVDKASGRVYELIEPEEAGGDDWRSSLFGGTEPSSRKSFSSEAAQEAQVYYDNWQSAIRDVDREVEDAKEAKASGGTARSYLDTEADKTSEITRQFKDFDARANLLYDLMSDEQEYGMRADDQNIQNLKAQKDLGMAVVPGGIYGKPSMANSLSAILRPSLPDYVRPDYRLNTAVGLPGAEGFDDPDYNEYGLPAFAGGTGDFIKIPPAPVVSWPWRKG